MKRLHYSSLRNKLHRTGLTFLTILALAPRVYAQTAKRTTNESVTTATKVPKYHQSVEEVGKRTKFSKHFANSDGSFTAQIGGNYHYKDENGTWQDIDLKLEAAPQGEYYFQSVKNDVKLYFPKNSANGMLKMVNEYGQSFNWWENNNISFIHNGNTLSTLQPQSVDGVAAAKKLTYPHLYPNVSEEFVLQEDGLENNLVIHQAMPQFTTLPQGASMQYSHFIPLQNGWIVRDAEGIIQHTNFEGKTFSIQIGNEAQQMYFGQTIVFDGTVSKEDAMKIHLPNQKLTALELNSIRNHVLALNHIIRFVEGGIEVSTSLPASWLLDSNRQYPITIDPTVTITPPTPTGNFYGPMTNWWGFQRHASLYLNSEITSFGMITALEYNRNTAGGNPANVPVTVHLKSTVENTLTGGNMWNDNYYTGGGELAFGGTHNVGSNLGWQMITLSTPYVYENGNLLVMVKDLYGGGGSTKYYNQSSTLANRQTYFRQDSSDPGDGVSMSLEVSRLTELRITYTPLVDCTGLPNESQTIASTNTICAADPLTLSLTDVPAASGIGIQWQSSTDGATWNNIGTVSMTHSLTIPAAQSVETQYRAIITCVPSQDEITSTPVLVSMSPLVDCYCLPDITLNCTDGDLITNVTFAGINNNSTCSSATNGYTNYTTTVAPAQVEPGESYPVSVTVGPSGEGWLYESVGVWIDYNHDGILDSLQGEYTPVGTGLNQAVTGTITIPTTALGGVTRMRVVVMASLFPLNAHVCGPLNPNENYGEMEDYSINIVVPNTTIDEITVSTINNVPAVINTYLGTLAVEATILPAAIDQSVTWSMVNGTGNATISNTGMVEAISNGTVWAKAISVYDPTKMDSLLITISNQIPPVDSVVVTTVGNIPAQITTPQGTLNLQAEVYPLVSNQAVTWSVISVTGSATITNTGVVSGQTNGTVWAKAISVQDITKADSILITLSNQDLSVSTLGANSINLYPNPTTNGVTIQSNDVSGGALLSVIDLNGKILFSDELKVGQISQGYTIDLSRFANGVYQIKITGNDINYQRQVIKQ